MNIATEPNRVYYKGINLYRSRDGWTVPVQSGSMLVGASLEEAKRWVDRLYPFLKA